MRNVAEMRDYVEKQFPERLKKLRQEIGVSQDELAKALGVSRASIGYYESKSRLPDIAFLSVLSETTGCSIDYLLGHSDNMISNMPEFALENDLTDREYEGMLGLLCYDMFRQFISNEKSFKTFMEIEHLLDHDFSEENRPFIYQMVEYMATSRFGQIFLDICNQKQYKKKYGDRSLDDVIQEINEENAKAREAFERADKNFKDEFNKKDEQEMRKWREKQQRFAETDKIEQFRIRLTKLSNQIDDENDRLRQERLKSNAQKS